MNLYEISENYICLLKMIEDESEIPKDVLYDTLEAVEGEMKDKADNIACIVKQLAAEAEAIRAEEKQLSQRRIAKEKNIESLKRYLASNLISSGITKMETARNKISFRRSEAVDTYDEDSFFQYAYENPDVLKEQKPQIDKTAIKKLLEEGADIPGCRIQVNQNIQIK